MLNIKKIAEISPEAKVSLIFGFLAFIVSLFFGLAVGNRIVILLTRVLFFTIVYATIGYASMLVIKHFVPEVYEILNKVLNIGQSLDMATESSDVTMQSEYKNSDDSDKGEGIVSSDSGNESIDVGATYNEAFTPLEAKDFTTFTTEESKPKKMGKHIVLDDKKIHYEPKIMAEAIRTMIKRDKD
ncbi:MAG TPA: hypothetical protein PLZ38_00285 [Spirochaetota bacterium]|nr:hypothetical protein [Spirochaetota bacterium]HOF12712.1 hypothetical protein [Spirochaetota bacterium]HOM87204.1 hypothetical protein [Spirochaetota bacterium]HOR92393.1 hypothetical protein [Spirochaetota bacterium]HOT19603.1 hypothetical protein [Spirochaetota bacterium]